MISAPTAEELHVVRQPKIIRPMEVRNGIKFHFDIEQNTPEWDAIRMGKITASPSACLVAPFLKKDGSLYAGAVGFEPFTIEGTSKTSFKYGIGSGAVSLAAKIADQIYNPTPDTEGFYGADMERGHQQEAGAKIEFEARYGVKLEDVGFVSSGDWIGCSPDKLIVGREEGWETKSANRSVHRGRLLDKESFKKEHYYQCQYSMMVTNYKVWYLCSYNPSYSTSAKLLVIKIERDESVIDHFKTSIKALKKQININLEIFKTYK